MRIAQATLAVFGLVGHVGCAVDALDEGDLGVEDAAWCAERLRYFARDITARPAGYTHWGPTAVTERGDVFGVGVNCPNEFGDCTFDMLKLDRDGNFTLIADTFQPGETNRNGDTGGCIIDEGMWNAQAAIVSASGEKEVLPRLPGEVHSCIRAFSDGGTALVMSQDGQNLETYYVLRNGRTYPAPGGSDINDRGEIAGTEWLAAGGTRAFRFDSRSQLMTSLPPAAGDPTSSAGVINRRGEVLGFSTDGDVQSVGTWDRRNRFDLFYTQGTAEDPVRFASVVWNDRGFIVATAWRSEALYVIPRPGVRLNVDDLLVNGSVRPQSYASAVNDRGDFLVWSGSDETAWVYERIR